MEPITKFDGEFAFLSNFFPSPITVFRKTWPTAEHMFQAQKTLNLAERESIRCASTPGRAKRLGRNVTMRIGWDNIKVQQMEWVVAEKFNQHPELAEKLLATGDAELIEGNNWHDTFWGVCNGVGENHLGKILMKVRAALRENEDEYTSTTE